MSLAMSTRNDGAMFASLMAFPVMDLHVFVMILLAVPVPSFVAFGIAATCRPGLQRSLKRGRHEDLKNTCLAQSVRPVSPYKLN